MVKHKWRMEIYINRYYLKYIHIFNKKKDDYLPYNSNNSQLAFTS